MSEKINITVNPEIIAKASPDMKSIKPKAVAGITEEELIERNVVGEFREEDEEEQQSEV